MFSTSVPTGAAAHGTGSALEGSERERLIDGADVWIRPIRAEDADLEFEFLRELSPEYRSSRFLGLVRDPSRDVARELTQIDPTTTVAFIALASADGRTREVAAAQLRINAAGDRCDCTLAVGESWQRRGIGGLLMDRLIKAARQRGVRHMRAFAPVRTGHTHRSLAASLGFERRDDPRDPAVVIYDLEL